MIIAVDGPVAAGKGTLARRIAAHYSLDYLDTGALYRAVGLKLLRDGNDPHNDEAAVEAARHVGEVALDDPALRDEATGRPPPSSPPIRGCVPPSFSISGTSRKSPVAQCLTGGTSARLSARRRM